LHSKNTAKSHTRTHAHNSTSMDWGLDEGNLCYGCKSDISALRKFVIHTENFAVFYCYQHTHTHTHTHTGSQMYANYQIHTNFKHIKKNQKIHRDIYKHLQAELKHIIHKNKSRQTNTYANTLIPTQITARTHTYALKSFTVRYTARSQAT
jgi:hypothetical protein